jgi:hypothetical protein
VYTEGVAYTYPLPVTDAQGHAITITAINPLPSGFTIVGVGLRYDGTVAAGNIANFRLRATANGLSTDSVAFSANIQAPPVSSGFFEGYQLSKFACVNYPSTTSYPTRGIETHDTKHTSWVQHPNGRKYLLGGDFYDHNPFGDYSFGTQAVWSYDPTLSADPVGTTNAWKAEHDHWPPPGNSVPYKHDKSSLGWDSKRRVFWQIAGMNYSVGLTGTPAGVNSFANKVGFFDPSKPKNTQWTNTGVPYLDGNNENHGHCWYDSVLDVVFSGTPLGGGVLQFFDCANLAWFGKVRFNSVPKLDAYNSYNVSVIYYDVPTRTVYLYGARPTQVTHLDPITALSAGIFKFQLPTSRTELPAAGASADWSAKITAQSWSNPNNILLNRMSAVMFKDGKRYLFSWVQGPAFEKNTFPSPHNDTNYGCYGHPVTHGAYGVYGSSTPAVVIDIDTGTEELVSIQAPVYEDGQGWVLPNITLFYPDTQTLLYGACAFEGVQKPDSSYLKIERKWYVYKKPLPAWVKNLNMYEWYEIPNSIAATYMASDAKAELAAREINELSLAQPGIGAWVFSGGTLRKKDSTLLVHGGGGAGGGRGNMVFGFTMNSETPYWWMPMPPTPKQYTMPKAGEPGYNNSIHWTTHAYNHDVTGNESVYNGQKTPVAIHAYSSCHFIDSEDLWIRVGAQMVWPTDGGIFENVDGFYWTETKKPYASRLWANNVKPDIGRAYFSGNRYWAKHPWTGDIIGGLGGRPMRRLNIATGTWSDACGWSDYSQELSPCIDPAKNILYIPRNTDAGTTHQHWLVQLDSGTIRYGSNGSLVGDVGSYSYGQGSAQIQWDEGNQQLVCLTNTYGLQKVVIEDPVTCTVRYTDLPTTVRAGSMPPQGPGTAIGGIISRFQYVPELGGFCLSTGHNRPVWFIRTHEIKV